MPKGIFHLRVAQISHRRYFTRRKAYFTQIWVYRRAINPNLNINIPQIFLKTQAKTILSPLKKRGFCGMI
jgi:hypothetical protein